MLPEINNCSKECVDLQELVKLSLRGGGNIVNHERLRDSCSGDDDSNLLRCCALCINKGLVIL